MSELDNEQALVRLRAAIAVGQEQIRRGEGVRFTPELMAEIDQEADERLRRNDPLDPMVTGE